jgi:hypothetical protein
MKGTLRIAVLTAAAMLMLVASARAAEVPSRAEYAAQVEPICEANTVANKRILKNVKERARSQAPSKVKQAGAQFIRASEAFGETAKKIAAVPRPPADDARLLKWFKHLGIVKTNLRSLGKALKEEEKILAAHEQIRVERSANAANNVSFVFEFRYCRLTPSRFF